MGSKTAGYAAPIVELHEGSKNIYKLNREELEKTIGRADIAGKKVALISIAGAFRKGKSFLLNFLVTFLEHLHKGGSEDDKWFDETTTLDNFNWRGGAERDTNGIFIWSVPYILEDQNKGEIVVFLMDTQGTFDHQSTVQDCATIFALSTLLSSVQIFNLSGQIQEDDLNNLRLFTEYAQLTKDENQHRAPFQKLLFLVRDWPNSNQYEYGYEGGQKYLENLLKTTPKQKKELKTLRENIKSSFETLEAFLMPYPGSRIAENNSEKVLGKVKEKFVEQLSNFVPSLFEEESFEAKKIGGKAITCGEITALFKKLMTIFNSDDLPEPKTILEATVDSINLLVEQKSRAAYDQHMKEKFLPSLSDPSTFENIHKTAEKLALDIFEARPKLGEERAAKVNKESLTKHFELRHDEYKRTVEQNIQVKEKEKRMEEEKKRIAAGQEAERQRIKAEEERIRIQKIENERRQREEADRLRREREEQERNRREQEERLRKEKERQQREYEERQAQMRRQQEEHQAQMRREQEEQERKNQEEKRRIQEEREEMARQQREAEERRKRDAQEQRTLMAALQRQSYTSNFCGGDGYSPSYSGGGGCFPSSYGGGGFSSGGGGSSNIRQETITIRGTPQVRYRDMNTGRFTKNPNS